MRLVDIDTLTKGEVLVATRDVGKNGLKINTGDEFIFDGFKKLEPTSASYLYLIDKSGTLSSYTPSIIKYLVTKNKYRDIIIKKLIL